MSEKTPIKHVCVCIPDSPKNCGAQEHNCVCRLKGSNMCKNTQSRKLCACLCIRQGYYNSATTKCNRKQINTYKINHHSSDNTINSYNSCPCTCSPYFCGETQYICNLVEDSNRHSCICRLDEGNGVHKCLSKEHLCICDTPYTSICRIGLGVQHTYCSCQYGTCELPTKYHICICKTIGPKKCRAPSIEHECICVFRLIKGVSDVCKFVREEEVYAYSHLKHQSIVPLMFYFLKKLAEQEPELVKLIFAFLGEQGEKCDIRSSSLLKLTL